MHVVRGGRAVVGGGHRNGEYVAGVGIGHGKGFGQGDEGFTNLDIHLIEVLGDGGAHFIHIPGEYVGGGIAVGDGVAVVVAGGVGHPGDEPDPEIISVAQPGGTGGDALVAEIPLHNGASTGGGDGAAGGETGRRIGAGRPQVDHRRFRAGDARGQFVADHEVAQ